MGMFEVMFWPFMATGVLIGLVVGALVLLFWIWMIVDCVKRHFKNSNEKIVWVIVIALTSWIGALVYYLAIKISNPQGLSKHKN